MTDALKAQEQDQTAKELSFLDRLGMLVDQQWSWRENQALARRLKGAKLRGNVCVEDIDYRAVRAVDKSVIGSLTPGIEVGGAARKQTSTVPKLNLVRHPKPQHFTERF